METATFAIHLTNNQKAAGLSLRGNCHCADTAWQLEQAVAEVLRAHPLVVWVDCQRLTSLSWHAQRAIFNVYQQARVAGTTLYWCGVAPGVLSQLATTGLHLLLSLLPAGSYHGPAALLQEVVPTAQHPHLLKHT